MNAADATAFGLSRRYLAAAMDPDVTLLEIHKLMYFMQEAGQPLKLQFSKARYGPYAENLRHVMNLIEGHFISGFGDAADNPEKRIEMKPEASQEAEHFLQTHAETCQRFDRVADLISGFETPYGMELLATVHWVATRENASTPDEAVTKTYAWNERKLMFREEHIRLAWSVLHSKNWLAGR